MSNPNPITTHVLNTSSGSPASGMNIVMEKNTSSNDREPVWEKFGNTVTNADGRGPGLISAGQMVGICGILVDLLCFICYFLIALLCATK